MEEYLSSDAGPGMGMIPGPDIFLRICSFIPSLLHNYKNHKVIQEMSKDLITSKIPLPQLMALEFNCHICCLYAGFEMLHQKVFVGNGR